MFKLAWAALESSLCNRAWVGPELVERFWGF